MLGKYQISRVYPSSPFQPLSEQRRLDGANTVTNTKIGPAFLNVSLTHILYYSTKPLFPSGWT